MNISPRRADRGQPVVFLIQSAKVDASGNLIGPPTKWYEGTLSGLNTDPNRGNAIRFIIELDRTKTPSGTDEILIDDVRVVFDC